MDQPKERIEIESPLEVANPDEERYQQNAEEECYFNNLPNEIFENIFRYLNYRELLRASMVCRKWSINATCEKSLRTGPYVNKDRYYSNAGHFEFHNIRQSTIKPFLGLFFLQSRRNSPDFNVKDALCELLPTNCKTIILFAYNVNLNETLLSNENNMVFALLPQISNVQINIVIVQENQLQGETYVEYKQMIETASRQNHESSMCIILLCKISGRSHFIGMEMAKIAYSRLCNSERVSLCGGTISSNLMINNETGVHDASCVALFITGSIRTWSIVFLEAEEEELAREKLQRFKEQIQLQKYSMGFVFYSYVLLTDYHKKNVSMIFKIFKEIFPKVLLIGCCSLLEFGINPAIGGKETVLEAAWSYQFSITFMILTYG